MVHLQKLMPLSERLTNVDLVVNRFEGRFEITMLGFKAHCAE
jgi:hypothetical protein